MINAIDILTFCGEHGIRYKEADLEKAIGYINRMVADNRVIIGEDMIVFFSMCNEFYPYLVKKTWEYLEHNSNGHIAYIEKAVSSFWSREMRSQIENVIVEMYPTAVVGKWHRYAKLGDREVTTFRRNKCLI